MDIRSVSGPGNIDPYKSGDPGLQTALTAAQIIEQNFPLSCERALGKLLVQEIQSLIGQGGTLKDFQGWLKNNDLLFQGPSYFGVTKTDVLYIYDKVAQESTSPTFTPMDDLMDQFATWINTDPVMANTPNFQLAIAMGFYPPTTPALFAQYCTQIADEGGAFSNFPGLINHPDEIYKFASLSGAPMELSWVKAMAQAQVNNTTGADQAFFQSIVTELNKCSTLADFQAWIKTTYGVQDAYMQNPGVDASAIANFYLLSGTPTAATTMDTDYAKLFQAVKGLPDATAILQQVFALGSGASEADFAKLFSSPKNDMYWQYPALSTDDVAKIYACFHKTPDGITDMDTALRAALAWKAQATGEAKLLATDLYNEISGSCNSQTAIQGGALSAWLTQQFGTYDIYWKYPGLTEPDAAPFFSICKIGAVKENTIDEMHEFLLSWKPGTPAGEDLRLALEKEIDSLNSGTPPQQFTAWINNTLLKTYDAYWLYPGISDADIQALNTGCGLSLGGESPMDKAYVAAKEWLASHSSADAAYGFINTLLGQITSEGSYKDPKAFLAQFTAEQDIYWKNTNFTVQDGLDIYAICQMTTKPVFTDMDSRLRAALGWLATPNLSGPAKLLATDLYDEISGHCNSQTPIQGGELSRWIAQKFGSDDVYWNYPGLTETDAAPFFSICEIGAVKENTIDEMHEFLLSWKPGTPAGEDLRLALEKEIDSLNSSTPPQQFTTWINNTLFKTNDAYWLYPGISDADIQALNAGCSLSLGGETDMDKAYFAVENWLADPTNPTSGPMYTFVNTLYDQIKTAGSYPAVATLLAPYSGANNDMYWQEPQLTEDNVKEIYTLLQQKEPPKFTDLDGVYRMTLTWMDQVKQSDPAAYQLASDLKAELNRRGSNGGSLAEWQTWIQTTLLGQDDVYWKYPGIIDTDVTQFETQYGVTGQQDTSMDKAYSLVQAWINTHGSSDPAYGFMKNLKLQIEGLGSYKSMSALTAQFGPPNNDIYWQHPQFTPQDILDVYSIFQQPVPGMTVTDSAYLAAENWLKANPAATPMHDFVYTLSQEIEALGSYKSLDSILKQFQSPNNDFYWQHPDLDATTIYQILQQPQAPSMTDTDKAYLAAENWLKANPAATPMHDFVYTLSKQIEALGSYKGLDSILSQFQPPNNDFYWQHPDLNATTIYQILQQPQAPGMNSMDTAYLALQNWLNTPPSGDDLALANALLSGFENLHSFDPFSDLTNWAQNFINSSSPIYTNASASAVQTFLNITGAVDTSFSKIQTDIQAYLAAETAAIAEIETMMRLRAPPNAAQARQFETYLNNMIATYGKSAVASRYGISVATLNTVLQELPVAGSYGSSNALFTAALAEIAELENNHGSLSALKAWAQSVNLSNYPGLSAADLAEFQKLLNLP